MSRIPRIYPCKIFLAGVNFYRFNAKNWHFRQILREKVAFFTDLTRKIGVFWCKFYSPKFCPCKKNDKYQVCREAPLVDPTQAECSRSCFQSSSAQVSTLLTLSTDLYNSFKSICQCSDFYWYYRVFSFPPAPLEHDEERGSDIDSL